MSNVETPPPSSSLPPSQQQQQQQPKQPKYPHILLGITGSVAAVKGPELAVRLVQELDAEVRILLTQGGYNFWTKAETYHPDYWREFKHLETCAVNPKQEQEQRQQQHEKLKEQIQQPQRNIDNVDDDQELLDELHPNIQVHYAQDEWADWKEMGDPILHIDLRDWADIIVLAPLSAHTLAKMAVGLCDDTLSCVMRAWDFGHSDDDQYRPAKPVVLAPAMNTAMWEHPLTASQLQTICHFWKPPPSKTTTTITITENGDATLMADQGVYIVAPQVKQLACGEVGNGALASVNEIIRVVKSALKHHS